MKKISLKKTKVFWLYYIAAAVCLLAAVVFAPLWEKTDVFFKSWGGTVIDVVIASLIVVYLCTYLIKKVARGNGVIKVLTIIEFALFSLIALGCVLSQFDVIRIDGPCQIVGAIMWCRGSIEVFRAYYFKGNGSKYPVWAVAVAVALITFGTFLYVKVLFTEIHLQWALAAIMLALMAVCIYAGVVTKPSKKKNFSEEK